MNGVAHVGYTKTFDDLERLTMCFDYLGEIGREDLQWNKPILFDLSKGKDFLTDTNKFNWVVLHFLFRGGYYVNQDIQVKQSGLRISPLSSWSSWRKRLTATEAKFIFVFGGDAEISGSFLVDIPNYQKVEDRPYPLQRPVMFRMPQMTIFKKIN